MKNAKLKTVRVPTIVDELPRKPPKKLNVAQLQPAFIEGKIQFKVGDELIMRRDHLQDHKLYICTVQTLHDDGNVTIRNLTLQQDFIFQISNPPTLWLYNSTS